MSSIQAFFKRKSVKYGIPFLVLIVGGSFGLKEFAKIRYDYRKVSPVREAAQKAGIEMKKSEDVTLEKIYDEMKDMDIDNWEQKRGPRPWEEDTMPKKTK